MSYTGSIVVEEIIEALTELGKEADVLSIQERVIKRRGGVPSHYASDRTCKQTIQAIIENYCPESDKYREDRIAYFSRVDRGRYRLLPKNERGYKERQYKEDHIGLPTIKRSSAKEMMSAHYKANKQSLPKSISDNRDEIISLLMQGVKVEDAFKKFL